MNALVLLDERCGDPSRGTRSIEGRLEMPTLDCDLQQLLDSAYRNRSDLRAAEESVTLAKQEEKLAIRERMPDVELVLGANYNTRVRNEEAPAPEYVGYSVGLTIPLPVLSVNSGVRKASKLRQQQAQLQSQSIVKQWGRCIYTKFYPLVHNSRILCTFTTCFFKLNHASNLLIIK